MQNLLNRLVQCAVVLCLLILMFSPGTVFASGFALIEQSASGLGNAFAGGSAGAQDASTLYFNPAGMTLLPGQQVLAVGHVIFPTAKFSNEGSTQLLQPITGVPLLGSNGGDGGQTKFVPNLYYTAQLTKNWSVGIGISAPFGLATGYDSGWVGRYYALTSDLTTVNINPAVAYRFNEHISIGAGVDALYANAKLSNAIDFGTLDAAGAFKALGIPAGALGLTPQKSDGFGEIKGDKWGWGWNVGALYEFSKDTRVGAAYRSMIKTSLSGDASFAGVPTGLAGYPIFKPTSVTADITFPDSFSLSFFQQINPLWAIMADVTWTHWSVFKELRVNYGNIYQAATVTTENWQDSWRYSLGVTLTPTPKWIFRGGVAYDQTPIGSDYYRTPRIPDQGRFWVALGVGYKFSDLISAELAYAHLFVNDPVINKVPVGEDAVRGGLKGTYDAYVNILSAQIKFTF